MTESSTDSLMIIVITVLIIIIILSFFLVWFLVTLSKTSLERGNYPYYDVTNPLWYHYFKNVILVYKIAALQQHPAVYLRILRILVNII